METLKRKIIERGYNIGGFAKICLGIEYHTFSYKCRTESFKFREIEKMTKMLKIKFEDLLA